MGATFFPPSKPGSGKDFRPVTARSLDCDDDDDDDEDEDDEDCKDFAEQAADCDSDLVVVRGYILLPKGGGFTEHWWCKSSRGTVVDVTSLAGCAGEYIPLIEKSERPTLLCTSMSGACGTRPMCEWCVLRRKLERKGHKRALIRVDNIRVVFDRLWADGWGNRS